MTLSTGANLGLLDNGDLGEQHYTELMRFFRMIDLLVQPHVKSATLTVPPTTPAEGDAYIIPANATGAWAGKSGQLARWTARTGAGAVGWEYITPKKNWQVGVDDAGATGQLYRFDGANWVSLGGSGRPTSLLASITPVAPDATDGAAYEMGVKLRFAQAGVITAIRYYKSPSETGAHTGHIWDANGVQLASVAFTGETASGWQEQVLPTPLRVAANTTYVVSVNVANHYAMTVGGLAATITSGDISSVSDGANGVFNVTPGAFPNASFNNSNYFRDVVFTGDTATVQSVVGYSAGQGGTATQTTSKSTAVTVNKPSGEITLSNASLAAGAAVAFQLNSTEIGVNDIVVPIIKRGATASAYQVSAELVVAGSCQIVLRNMSGAPLAEAVVIGFAVIKGSIN